MKLTRTIYKAGLVPFFAVALMFSGALAGDSNSFWDTYVNHDGTLNLQEFKAAVSNGMVEPVWFSQLWDLETGQELSAPQSTLSSVPDDDNWSSSFAVPGVDNKVYAAHELGGSLYIAGRFKFAGGVIVNHIARWDGTNFWPLDEGVKNPAIEEMGEYQGNLIIAGRYLDSISGIPVNGVAMWDGLTWSGFGSGLESHIFFDVSEFQGMLLVSGSFSPVGGGSYFYLAAWNGTEWSDFGSGLNGFVRTISIFQDELIVGGDFTMAGSDTLSHIARWDGSAWQPLGVGVDGDVWALRVFESVLIVGGSFTHADGLEALHVASWDGAGWSSMDAGVNENNRVQAFEEVNGQLFGSGGFNVSWGFGMTVAKWSGTEWTYLLDREDRIPGQDREISSFGGKLVLYGTLDAIEGLLMDWDGIALSPIHASGGPLLGLNSCSLTSTIHENQIVTAGLFRGAGGQPANHIVQGDGSSWTALGAGLSGNVRNVGHFGPHLVAAGQFDFGPAENRSNGAVAIWRDGVWQAIGEELLGTGSNGATSIVEHDGQLVAGGLLSFEGAIGANIAAWDGNNWKSVGLGVDAIVQALASYRGKLIAGGGFERAGLNLINYLAAWDGAEWKPLGEGTPGPVHDLLVQGANLIAGGETESGEGFVRIWDGASWTDLGAGTLNGRVEEVALLGCQIYAGGHFGSNVLQGGEPEPLQHIARWDGTQWTSLGSGFNAPVFTLQPFDGKLFVGGCFNALSGTDKATAAVSIWTPPAGRSCCDTPGDADRSGRVNIADVTFMISRIFSGGPAPCCMDESDSNGDNRTNISDVTFMISRIFAKGAAPVCGTTGL